MKSGQTMKGSPTNKSSIPIVLHTFSSLLVSMSVLSLDVIPRTDAANSLSSDSPPIAGDVTTVYAQILSACYLTLSILSAIQLFRTIVHRHKIRSFRFGFLLVCFLWTMLRVVWFMVEMSNWPRWMAGVTYFLPSHKQINSREEHSRHR